MKPRSAMMKKEPMMISDANVSRLEIDQRRDKTVADRMRGEIISRIHDMREIEGRLEAARLYVEEWEDSPEGSAILAILSSDVPEPAFPPGQQRPDRRKRWIMQLYHRHDVAIDREKRLLAYVEEMLESPNGDADAEDLKKILLRSIDVAN
jgi:hypothetical protein